MLTGRMRMGVCAALLIGSVIVCAGCGSNTELEESNFPLAAMFDYEDGHYRMTLGMEQLSDVADEKATKENHTGIALEGTDCYKLFEMADVSNPGKMDYNHMKALILNSRLLEDKAKMEELFAFLEEQELIARNTLLFVTDVSGKELMGMSEALKEPVGTYLDEMIASDIQSKNRAAVTLGTFYNTWNNQNENLYIPYLTAAKEKVLFEHYYLMQGRNAIGTVERTLGDMALLTEQKLAHYGVELLSGELLKLSDITCRYELEETDDGIAATVYVRAEARQMNGRIEGSGQQNRMRREAEQYLESSFQKAAEEMQERYDTDIANSFYLLGGYNRKAYRQYKEDWALYRRNLRVEYDWEIIPVNL